MSNIHDKNYLSKRCSHLSFNAYYRFSIISIKVFFTNFGQHWPWYAFKQSNSTAVYCRWQTALSVSLLNFNCTFTHSLAGSLQSNTQSICYRNCKINKTFRKARALVKLKTCQEIRKFIWHSIWPCLPLIRMKSKRKKK